VSFKDYKTILMDIAFRLNKQKKAHAILKNRLSLLIILLTLFFYSKPMHINAQCSGEVAFDLTSLTFPANLWRIEDILNVRIENKTSQSLKNVYLVATVDQVGISELFEITSGKFTLTPLFFGVVNPSDLEPIRVADLNLEFSAFARDVAVQTGSLPAGTYHICVRAISDSTSECIGEGCVDQEVAHPSPPELINPVNEGFVMEDLPVFSWLPPMPSTVDLKYNIEIVEMLDGQTPIEAIESNLEWFYQNELNTTSFQYPLGERAFINGVRYAWRIEALMGQQILGSDVNPKILSQVWSFTFMGQESSGLNEEYFVNLVSPGDNDILTAPPFFEWELTNPLSQNTTEMAVDEDIYFDVKIWKWPDSVAAGDAKSYKNDLANNPDIAPYYEADKLNASYFNIAETAPDTIKGNHTYFWKVNCIKNEMIIAESGYGEFSFVSDKSFIEAAESMLKAVDVGEDSKVYGITEPVTPGAIIISEVPSDLDTIEVKNTLYLFIIDDEPWARYGHPVRYALVDKDTKAVTEYDANWFPEVKNVEDPWNSTGEVKVGETEVTMLTPRNEAETVHRARVTADISDAALDIDCGNYVLMIDGGDRNRTGTTDNIASRAAGDADSFQALYETKNYMVQRFSQYWDNKIEETKCIPVDPNTKSGTKFIKEMITGIKEHYVSMGCCTGENLNFELVIYINANAIPSTTKFKIYKQDGSGVSEDIDYFNDILKYLQTLPQCVKITLFVDANFSGSVVDAVKLDSYLKRGNYEIRTATDAKHTTPSGVGSTATAAKPVKTNQPAVSKPAGSSARGSEESFTAMELAEQNMDQLAAKQETAKVDLGASYAKVDESAKNKAAELHREDPNPQYARIKTREEFSLQFPVQKDQAGIKECDVDPDRSANVILNEMNGLVTIFSKIKGVINIIVTYENNTEEKVPITSSWGDNTSH
jgi:hypothetical protein